MKRLILFVMLAMLAAAAGFIISCSGPKTMTEGKGNEGLLAIFCEPNDASVFVDNVFQGKAKQFDGRPGYLQLTSGQHAIRLEMNGYQPYRQDVYVSDDGKEELKINLRKK